MSRAEKPAPCKKFKPSTDFSKVGGLAHHLKILRDTIIVPLLHNNVYTHFNIKSPRGILFYGPPGTGKTLVAGALATEINREGFGKVTFYQRKGADVLDKWVGESEKKLRALFEQANKTRPSIIFFDELDGLAPTRSGKNDHVHCSIVTTLLALMDGLDSMPGIIVIGATNRIESVDPALRRPGRFDRELYFPLPGLEARKEILTVHINSWTHKPSSDFIDKLAESTTGFCGSDLQALCAETLLFAIKRCQSNGGRGVVKGNKIEASELRVEEDDFIQAQKNMIPTSTRLGNKMRKLGRAVAPLLQRQLDTILIRLKMVWPHFFVPYYKYVTGSERYAGKLILIGSSVQGLTNHLVPAILQNFEHLPSIIIDSGVLLNRESILNFSQVLPSIVVIPRIDEMWNYIDCSDQNLIVSMLENVHAALPVLVIVTHEQRLPLQLQHVFYDSTTLSIVVETPCQRELEDFFVPPFFGEAPSMWAVLCHCRGKALDEQMAANNNNIRHHQGKRSGGGGGGGGCTGVGSQKVYKIREHSIKRTDRSRPSMMNALAAARKSNDKEVIDITGLRSETDGESLCTLCGTAEKKQSLSRILLDMLHRTLKRRFHGTLQRRTPNCVHTHGDSTDVDRQRIYNMWRRTVYRTAKNMPLAQLEIIYDTIVACISIHKDNFQCLVKNLDATLQDLESANKYLTG